MISKNINVTHEVNKLFDRVKVDFALSSQLANDRSNEAKWYASTISRETNTCVKETTVERALRSIRSRIAGSI